MTRSFLGIIAIAALCGAQTHVRIQGSTEMVDLEWMDSSAPIGPVSCSTPSFVPSSYAEDKGTAWWMEVKNATWSLNTYSPTTGVKTRFCNSTDCPGYSPAPLTMMSTALCVNTYFVLDGSRLFAFPLDDVTPKVYNLTFAASSIKCDRVPGGDLYFLSNGSVLLLDPASPTYERSRTNLTRPILEFKVLNSNIIARADDGLYFTTLTGIAPLSEKIACLAKSFSVYYNQSKPYLACFSSNLTNSSVMTCELPRTASTTAHYHPYPAGKVDTTKLVGANERLLAVDAGSLIEVPTGATITRLNIGAGQEVALTSHRDVFPCPSVSPPNMCTLLQRCISMSLPKFDCNSIQEADHCFNAGKYDCDICVTVAAYLPLKPPAYPPACQVFASSARSKMVTTCGLNVPNTYNVLPVGKGVYVTAFWVHWIEAAIGLFIGMVAFTCLRMAIRQSFLKGQDNNTAEMDVTQSNYTTYVA